MNEPEAKIISLYKVYREVVNPLVIDIETITAEFPISILNEIRDFVCHISRAYTEDGVISTKEIEKAEGHIERIILDCYKSLILLLDDKCVKKFNKTTKNIDLTIVNNGEFISQYNSWLKKTQNALRIAKKSDADLGKKTETLEFYKDALNEYRTFESFLDDAFGNINWAKRKKRKQTMRRIAAWVASALVLGLASSLVIDYLKQWIISIS